MEAFVIIVAVALLAAPVLAIWTLVRTTRLAARLDLVERRLTDSRSGLATAGQRPEPEAQPSQVAPQALAADPQAEPAAGEPEVVKARDSEFEPPRPEPEPVASEAAAVGDGTAAAIGSDRAAAERPEPGGIWQRFEEGLAARWLVWLGSLALALGGLFLVKYSIDNDLIPPGLRIALGLLFGAALVVSGEWLRRRPLQRAVAALGPDFVPPALSAAGVAVCFASLYAGYELYGLFSPLVAFLSMAAVAYAALALSLLQGPFIAVIGLLGAFAVPLLVRSDAPSAWALFPYLWVVAASALAVVRFRDWWWLAWLCLLGTTGWALLWLTTAWQTGDAVALSAHLLVSLALFAAPRFEALLGDQAAPLNPFDPRALAMPHRLAQAAALCVGGVLILLLPADDWGTASMSVAAVVILALVAAAFRLTAQENLLALAAATALAGLATWVMPSLELLAADRDAWAPLTAPFLPPQLTGFCAAAAATALLFAVAGYHGLWRSRFPGYWSSLSAAVPLLTLVIVYWRLNAAAVALPWADLGLALAALALAAAARVSRSRKDPGMESALGCYSLAVSAGITLAVALALEEKWWPIALALQLPAAAWADHRLRVRYLRPISLAIALYVSARLLLQNLPYLPLEAPGDAFAILYSYGLPTVSFALAAHWFRKRADDWLVKLLESGTIAFGVALVTLQIHSFVGELNDGHRFPLLDMSLRSLAWLITGWMLYRRDRLVPRAVSRWSAGILIAAAAGQVLVFQLGVQNPLITGDPVGTWPVLNLLLPAYALPGALAVLVQREARLQGHGPAALAAALLALALPLVSLTLEVRHLAHGPVLVGGPMTDAEGYAYSLVWLAYAGVLLAGGLLRRNIHLRAASLALVLVVVAKVFLWDMSWLTGLYRVASFVGLGLSLVGIGLLYQRLILRPRAGPQTSDDQMPRI